MHALTETNAEWLSWRRGAKGKPFRFLDYKDGQGRVISGEMPEETDRVRRCAYEIACDAARYEV